MAPDELLRHVSGFLPAFADLTQYSRYDQLVELVTVFIVITAVLTAACSCGCKSSRLVETPARASIAWVVIGCVMIITGITVLVRQ